MKQESLARKLQLLRAERGLTLVQASALTGVTRGTLSELEGGKRVAYMPTLSKIAEGYGVDVRELLLEESAGSPKVSAPLAGQPETGHPTEASQRVWERINLLEAAAAQWQRFIDEGLYNLKKLDLELLQVVYRVSLGIIINHARDAAEMKRTSTDEERLHLEQAEQRLIDANLAFWARAENKLARENVTELEAVRAQRARTYAAGAGGSAG